LETAQGVSVEDVRKKTAAEFDVAENVGTFE
jgi:acyl CoA:acetate/3-ketoacid CoA transferase beta subunit